MTAIRRNQVPASIQARSLPWLLAAALLTAAPAAEAELCRQDDRPAATLLLPYFEVDLAPGGGADTLVSVANVRGKPVAVRAVLWTDLGLPTAGFSFDLRGWQVRSFSLRAVFAAGVVPHRTGGGGVLAPPCAADADLPPDLVTELRRAHRGEASGLFDGGCGAQDLGDGVFRGYLTIDVIGDICRDYLPGGPGYFGEGGLARFDDVLRGEYFHLDPVREAATSGRLLGVEADPTAFGAGDATFYGRLVGGDGSDGREPLATIWSGRFLNGGAFDSTTDLLVWRDPGAPPTSFPCGETPAWYPLPAEDVLAFDEENPLSTVHQISEAPFPAASNRIAVSSLPDWPEFGWFAANLGTGDPFDPVAQGWMGTVISASGRYSVALGATPGDSGCEPSRCAVGTPRPGSFFCLSSFEIPVGGEARFHLFPDVPGGGTSCLEFPILACSVTELGGGELGFDARFCHDPNPELSAICGVVSPPPVDSATCQSAGLAAGDYRATFLGQTIEFTVPRAAGPWVCTGP